MSTMGERIRRMRKARNMSQQDLCEALGVSRSAIAMWEADKREPDIDKLREAADVLAFPVSELIIGEKDYAGGRRVPVLGSIRAGVPISAIEDILDWEELSPSMINREKEYFALRIKGNSMEPEYREGDVIILSAQTSCESGSDCAVMVGDEDATFKRVRIRKDTLTLQPLNPAYEPLVFTSGEVEQLPVRIIGVVVELRRRFKA